MSEVLAPVRHRVALVGAAIGGSLSPALHEREAAALGLDYTYTLLDLETLPPEWTLRDAVGITGFNVTHPAKQAVIPQLDDLSPDARALGAVNTVTVDGSRLIGHNTDHSGFLAGLRHGLPGARLGRVIVVGAGGAGSAVAYALAGAGAAVGIADPDHDRLDALLARLRGRFRDISAVDHVEDALSDADGIVNATPIGMTGHPGMPFDPGALSSRHWVAEVVYRPLATQLLLAARTAGCRALDGGAMLVAQAAETLSVLTGATPDLGRMRAHLGELTTKDSAHD
ncbi:shikimate dehydrogenase [Amycolatopsis bartoniae]|uniref:Shikimate dehydrogenase (NADP(+)) n=1 Tax=Amycolatopsis bartoniae TaxID=941986 RepID=A0A8H9IWT9_9PSEU|nr:shikimate dehydrogenase [Amycolatopsis bartoniae]MBB2938417.1 shikimate dehydrogenase [Amycolatopsis bartoniae]TVT06091.1 shikimate dehydrogenase [Amycolatopsis bartoniae]GHF71168.1 shikimate dehydrogenase (NADP(+)) [Amycolatopsis bartoniae]